MVGNRPSLEAFAHEVELLRQSALANLSIADFHHLKKIEKRGRLCCLVGYLTAWIIPNPITAFLLSMATFTRWMLAHHILHRAYDKIPGVPDRYTSRGFAKGWRRIVDWFDWILPAAWDYEHNILHHYYTGEDTDPDVAERHTEYLRELPLPRFVKYLIMVVVGCNWKWGYYAPSTLSVLHPKSGRRLRDEHIVFITIKNVFDWGNPHVRLLWLFCYLPYLLVNFAVVPILFLPLGPRAALFVLMNKILAEVITNFHTFMVVVPNHTADDICRYQFHYHDKGEFYMTQILGSTNYACGGDLRDHLHGWLNYQIEHHVFPDLPMSAYQRIQRPLRALCEKYRIPYRQESVFTRFRRMLDVCVGKTSMPRVRDVATCYEQMPATTRANPQNTIQLPV